MYVFHFKLGLGYFSTVEFNMHQYLYLLFGAANNNSKRSGSMCCFELHATFVNLHPMHFNNPRLTVCAVVIHSTLRSKFITPWCRTIRASV